MKVSLIAEMLIEKDAISSSTRSKALAIQEIFDALGVNLELKVFVAASDYNLGGYVKKISSVNEVLFDEHFRSSDLIVYDFGIYYSLFDSIHLAPPAATKIVHYHNITPAKYAAAQNQEYINMSFIQRVNILKADVVFSGSEFNRQDLIEFGVKEENIAYLNYVVDFPEDSGGGGPAAEPANAAGDQIEPAAADEARVPGTVDALYVGRFVQSKGLEDLLRALRLSIDDGAGNIHLRLAGSLDLSDPGYFQKLEALIGSLGLGEHVDILDGLTDEERDRWYRRSDLFVTASYHEGFCIPVVEALGNGCYVITSDAGNLPYAVNGLGNVVETGDVAALAAKISEYVREKSSGKPAGQAILRTDSGDMSEEEFWRKGLEYSREFSFERLKTHLLGILNETCLNGR